MVFSDRRHHGLWCRRIRSFDPCSSRPTMRAPSTHHGRRCGDLVSHNSSDWRSSITKTTTMTRIFMRVRRRRRPRRRWPSQWAWRRRRRRHNNQLLVKNWGGGYERIGWVGGMKRRRWAWLGIPFLDSDFWDDRNSEFRFRVRNSGIFRRKIKSENLKTVQVENRNSGSDFSGIPEFR